jgi:mono/diheme cytochrome c family protein
MFCSSCHGLDGKGMQAVGAPNLTDGSWLYENTAESIRYTVVNGRNNMMPAQLELLGEQKVRVLAAYVMSISPRPPAPEAAAEPVEADVTAGEAGALDGTDADS